MKSTPITLDMTAYPDFLKSYLTDAIIVDRSCSPEATVLYLAKDDGFFLKRAKGGHLAHEAALTAYFHGLDLAPDVLLYERENDLDWLLTKRLLGDDLRHPVYLKTPQRLATSMGSWLRELHAHDATTCPAQGQSAWLFERALKNRAHGHFKGDFYPASWSFPNADRAWSIIVDGLPWLQDDTLLHGDFCLPNIIADNWQLTGYIDLDTAGVGDRHYDLFWALWTLHYNLGTARYGQALLDAYGRDKLEREKLDVVAALITYTGDSMRATSQSARRHDDDARWSVLEHLVERAPADAGHGFATP